MITTRLAQRYERFLTCCMSWRFRKSLTFTTASLIWWPRTVTFRWTQESWWTHLWLVGLSTLGRKLALSKKQNGFEASRIKDTHRRGTSFKRKRKNFLRWKMLPSGRFQNISTVSLRTRSRTKRRPLPWCVQMRPKRSSTWLKSRRISRTNAGRSHVDR
jgi:hypothetical protein